MTNPMSVILTGLKYKSDLLYIENQIHFVSL